MLYTYQEVSDSGSFTSPYPDDVHHTQGKDGLECVLNCWIDSHYRIGADEDAAALWVCKGKHESIEYPDWVAYYGPRGGFRMDRA